MKDLEIKTTVVHSESKDAWNVIGCTPGKKYKIARVPYVATENKKLTAITKAEAKNHAEFISFCFNNSDKIIEAGKLIKSINDLIS